MNSPSSASAVIGGMRLESQHLFALPPFEVVRQKQFELARPGDRLLKNATHPIDPQRTFIAWVDQRPVTERTRRSGRLLNSNSSARAAVGDPAKVGPQYEGQRPLARKQTRMSAWKFRLQPDPTLSGLTQRPMLYGR